jgi:phage-related protein (TIGR01555 family)
MNTKKRKLKTTMHIYTTDAPQGKAVRAPLLVRIASRLTNFRVGTEERLSEQIPQRTAQANTSVLFDGVIDDSELLYGAKREPIATRIISGVAEDVFSKWFKIIDLKDPTNRDLDKTVQAELERLDAKQHLIRMAVLERLYGYAVLVIGFRDSAQTLAEPVDNPITIDDLDVYGKTDIATITEDTDPESENYLYPDSIRLNYRAGNEDIHKTRFIWTSTRLIDHRYLGVSALECVYDDLNALRRIRWSLGMTMIRQGSGFPDVELKGASRPVIDAFIASGQFDNLNAMRYFVHNENEELNFKGIGSTGLDPQKYIEPIFESISAGTKIPVPVLRGVQAGALTGSEVNEREYAKLITSVQALYEKTVKQLITAIMNINKLTQPFKVEWNPVIEMDERTKAEIVELTERARSDSLKYKLINEVRTEVLGEGEEVPEGNVILSLVQAKAQDVGGTPQPQVDASDTTNLQKKLEDSLRKLLQDVLHGTLDKDQAALSAETLIDEHIGKMKQIAKRNLERKVGRPIGDLSPENDRMFVTMKKRYVADFKRILADAKQ